MKKKTEQTGPLAHNKKVAFDYEIMSRYEAGIELVGTEVKATRNNKASLVGAYITVRGGEAFLMNADIAPYQEKNTPPGYEPKRNRRILLKKAELAELAHIDAKKGLTIVPISMYNSKGSKIKVEIAIVRGKKKYDKRETMKKRDTDRQIHREFAI